MKRLGLVLILVLGCRGATEIPALSGRVYVLQSIQGETLPTTFSSNPYYPLLVYADTLALHEDGTAERRTLRQGDGADEKVAERTMMHWTRSGSDIAITIDCPKDVFCSLSGDLSGTEANGTITITQSTINRVPLVYQYLPPFD